MNQPTQILISISATTTPTTGEPFIFTWSVTTNTSNSTENDRLRDLLNGDLGALAITLSANTLLEGVLYTLTATIGNIYGYYGNTETVSFTPVPFPDFTVIGNKV